MQFQNKNLITGYSCSNEPCAHKVNKNLTINLGDIPYFFCTPDCRTVFTNKRKAGAAERVAAFLEKKKRSIIESSPTNSKKT